MRRSRFALLLVVAAVLVTSALVGPASASPGAYKVLIVYADSDVVPTTFVNQIQAQAGIGGVDTFNGGDATPDTATLAQYDLVIVFADNDFSDSTALGNELADYADQGGVVMEWAWAIQTRAARELQGRWASGGYDPVVGGTNTNVSRTLGSFDASSPLMQGVNTMTDVDVSTNTVATGATQVAATNDGHPLVVYKGRAVAVTFYPGDNGNSPHWSGDFGRLAANAVNWLGRHNLTVATAGTGAGTVTSGPAGINCGATCSTAYAYAAPVTLTATPAPGSTFAGWTGGCAGTAPCTVTMDAAKNVTATFNAIPVLPAFGGLTVSGKTVTVKNGKVAPTVSCPASSVGNCVGTDTLQTASKVIAPKLTAAHKKKAKILKLGKGKFSIAAGKSGKVTIKLNRTALKLLAKKHRLKVKQTIVSHDSRNLSETTSGNLKVKAAKQKKKKKH